MSEKRNPDEPAVYRIAVQGRLDETRWDWFEEMMMTVEIRHDGPPVTILTGRLPDQAALQGILSRIGMLNLKLISVREMERGSDETS
ncbi:MAG TPA: hypothetical protein VLD63_02745 [Anaerolineales bacterium]|nr:hypothetical protein [Anaerolineales bacterium]